MGKLPFGKYKVRISPEYDKAKLEELIKEESLNNENTRRFIDMALRTGYMVFLCMDFPKILPRMSLFDPAYGETKERVWEKLTTIMCVQEAV